MDNRPMFSQVSTAARLARCSSCGAVVDASDDGRRIHLRWHEAHEGSGIIDLRALDEVGVA